MAWGARLGLKRCCSRRDWHRYSRLNGLGSPFGIETLNFVDVCQAIYRATWPWEPILSLYTVAILVYHSFFSWLNGLGSPFGFQPQRFPMFSSIFLLAKWPGEPVWD